MLVLYLGKTSNDFYGIQYDVQRHIIYATLHFIAPDTWPPTSPLPEFSWL